jgi:hypothetical protein
MPIRPSSAADVARLVEELSSSSAFRRETAAARLAVIGARAISALTSLALDDRAPARARVAALQALESIGDSRALPMARKLADNEGEIGTAAIGVIGAVAKTTGPAAAQAFEWLAAVAMDAEAAEARRLASLAALEGSSDRHLEPIYAALAADPNERLSAHALRGGSGQTEPLESAISRLPNDPRLVAAMIREDADTTDVAALRRLVDAIRQYERGATGDVQAAWTAARGQVHQTLAARGSRLGVYDLRETLEMAHGPLPVGFLAAAAAVGDAACLDPLAGAWGKAPVKDRWWREHLAEAFRAIVKREGLTRRHPVLKKLLERRPEAGALVALAKKN